MASEAHPSPDPFTPPGEPVQGPPERNGGHPGEGPDWSFPVTVVGPVGSPADWTLTIREQYVRLLELADSPRRDAIGASDWDAVVNRFDAGVEPKTPDEANERFRELVVGVWRLREKWEGRERVKAAARRGRR